MFIEKLDTISVYLPDVAGGLALTGTLLAFIVYRRFSLPEKYPIYDDRLTGYLVMLALACLSATIALIDLYTALKVWHWWFT